LKDLTREIEINLNGPILMAVQFLPQLKNADESRDRQCFVRPCFRVVPQRLRSTRSHKRFGFS
jgi:hypothetical protein